MVAWLYSCKGNVKKCEMFTPNVCLFGSYQRINPCGSLGSDGIKLNMMKMEKVKIYKIK